MANQKEEAKIDKGVQVRTVEKARKEIKGKVSFRNYRKETSKKRAEGGKIGRKRKKTMHLNPPV